MKRCCHCWLRVRVILRTKTGDLTSPIRWRILVGWWENEMTLKCECCGSRAGLTRDRETANVYCLPCSKGTCTACESNYRGSMQQIMYNSQSYKVGGGYNNKRKWWWYWYVTTYIDWYYSSGYSGGSMTLKQLVMSYIRVWMLQLVRVLFTVSRAFERMGFWVWGRICATYGIQYNDDR